MKIPKEVQMVLDQQVNKLGINNNYLLYYIFEGNK